jgi:hypothetical protein
MTSEALSRTLGVLEVDYSTISPVVTMFSEENYDKALDALLEAEQFSDDTWKTTALTHRLMVAYDPQTADQWLNCVATRLCTVETHTTHGVHQGTIVGLLEAGVWLDKGLYQVSFQKELLGKLVTLVCQGKPRKKLELPHSRGDSDGAGFNKRFVHALNEFLFPTKTTHILKVAGEETEEDPLRPDIGEAEMKARREMAVRNSVRQLQKSLPEAEHLHHWSQLFIERLTHALLARIEPKDKVAAICHVL